MRYFWNFFWPKSNPYMPLVNFRKKFRLVSFDFRQNFEVRTFTRWLSIRGTKFFLRDIKNFFFFKIFTMVLLDGLLDGFSKFWFFIIEICILIRDFWVISKIIVCACWAYVETIHHCYLQCLIAIFSSSLLNMYLRQRAGIVEWEKLRKQLINCYLGH